MSTIEPTASVASTMPPPANRSGQRRWMICGLLLFAATVNYMDRQVIALLKPILQVQFGWDDVGYSNIVLAFQFAYAAGLLFVGKLIDRLGTRKGFSLSVFVWSIAAMAHAAASSILQFAAARFSLGLGESGSFPASIKAVAEWFPKRERSLATGLFNSGTNIGAMVTPLVVPWLAIYRRPQDDRRVSASELAYIESDPGDPQNQGTIPWIKLLSLPQTWALALGKFFTDPIWWVYLFCL